MGINTPKLINCEVMHQRLSPRKNAFRYDVYYLGIPLSQIESNAIGEILNLNRFGLHSFYEKDHGYRDGTSLKAWRYDMFDTYKFEKPKEVFLISMPRILGYVFNPVSFWFCGAWQKYGFHEDGLSSAINVVKDFGVKLPWE